MPAKPPEFDLRSSSRAAAWRLRTRELQCGSTPLLMGIVNVTPDSFSDGGQFFDLDSAVEQAVKLADEGADILDVGGESTRPYSEPVGIDEELRRVMPVVESLRKAVSVPVSIDTSKSVVARAAIEAGAEAINDVTGLTGDARMLSVAAETGAGVCVMHMQGTPQTMQDNPCYSDVVQEIHQYLAKRKEELIASGIPIEKICLDPGIGFGKTHEHNLVLLANCWRFQDLGCPLLVGHSRKGFLKKLLGSADHRFVYATLGASFSLALQGVQILRLHEIRPFREAWRAFSTLKHVE